VRDDDSRTPRQIARGKQRRAGDRSAALANALMRLPGSAIAKLQLDDELRGSIERARAITSHIARRRAERTLAGELRRHDLDELDATLAEARETGASDARLLHLAESWRARLIDERAAALAEFPHGDDPQLRKLVDDAQRERATGLPRGAARALFRRVVELLQAEVEP